MRTIKVHTGNLVASVTVVPFGHAQAGQAQPWDEGHVARVVSARACQPLTKNY